MIINITGSNAEARLAQLLAGFVREGVGFEVLDYRNCGEQTYRVTLTGGF